MASIESLKGQIAYHESAIQELKEELRPKLEALAIFDLCDHEWNMDLIPDELYESLVICRTCSQCKIEQYAHGIVGRRLFLKSQEEWVWKNAL